MVGPGEVTLNWVAPAFNSQTITQYEYTFKEDEGAYRGYIRAGTDPTKTTYKVTGLKPDTMHTFRVRARNSAGASPHLEFAPVTPGDTAPTSAPTLSTTRGTVTVDVDDTDTTIPQITLSWNAVPAANNGGSTIMGYEIQWTIEADPDLDDDEDWTDWDTGTAGFAEIDEGSRLTAKHTQVMPGTTYRYRVRAFNDADGDSAPGGEGETGLWSNVSFKTTLVVKPGQVILAAFGSDPMWDLNVNSITIKWTALTDTEDEIGTGGGTITSYQIWVGTEEVLNPITTEADEINDLPPTITGVPTSPTEYMNVGLSPETTYHFRVRAVNSAGVGPYSDNQTGLTTDEEVATPGTPATPAITTVERSSVPATIDQLTVNWVGGSQGTSPLLRYEIQHRREANDDTVLDDLASAWVDATIASAGPLASQYVHKGLEGGAKYVYRVRAVNGIGESRWSTAASQVMLARVPGVPVLIAIANGKNEMILEWTVPATNGAVITDYNLQRWIPGDGDMGTWTADLLGTDLDPDSTLFIDRGDFTNEELTTPLDAGKTYYYRIQALNGAPGTAVWSSPNVGVSPSRAKAASAKTDADVPGPVAWADTNGAVVGTGDGAQTITLTWVALEDNGGLEITGYEIRVWDGSQWVREATPAATATEYKDTGLTPGAIYHYVIRASNSQGSGPWSPTISATARAVAPDVPVLTATASSRTTIILEWTVPNNNGSAITDYDIQGSTLGPNGVAGEWTEVVLGTGDTTATLHTDGAGGTPLLAGTTYYYRIRAENGANDGDDNTGNDNVGKWSADRPSEGVPATTHRGVPAALTLSVSADTIPTVTRTITVTWDAPTDTGGSALTGYELHVWDSANRRWVHESNQAHTASKTTPYIYTDTGLASGKSYYYRVRAINGEGAGAWSELVPALTPPRQAGCADTRGDSHQHNRNPPHLERSE